MTPKNLLEQKIGHFFQDVVTDSRLVEKGDLFVALAGERVDGHQFVKDAHQKGASAAIVAKKVDVDIPQYVVDDPVSFLQDVVREYVRQVRPRVIAITGSVGKTTTKEYLKQILSPYYSVAATPGNLNSQIGIPLSLFNYFKGDEDYWIIEMGMSYGGEITKLCEMIPPEISVVTHVAAVHAANFEQLEFIADAKGEILKGDSVKVAFINSRSNYLERLLKNGSCQKIIVTSEKAQQRFPQFLAGEHLYENLALAMEVALHLGLNEEQMQKVVPTLSQPSSRMELLIKQGITILNDSYNASEISVIAALKSFPKVTSGKKIAVIGQMQELGIFSDEAHKNVAQCALDAVDHMICFGEKCKPIYELWTEAGRKVFWTKDRAALLQHINSVVSPGDFMLLKGSRSNQLNDLIPEIKPTL